MKKRILKLTIVVCFAAGIYACQPDIDNEINVETPEQTTDPDNPEPGCDNPNGCKIQ